MRKTILLAALVLTMSVGLVGAQEENQEDRIANVGAVTPDSALYGLETAWDNAGMAIRLKSPGKVARERAAEAEAMAEKEDYKSAQKAMDNMKSVARRAREEDSEDIGQAESVLEGVIENAPDEARKGLQTAMENIRNNKPDRSGNSENPGRPGQTNGNQPEETPDETGEQPSEGEVNETVAENDQAPEETGQQPDQDTEEESSIRKITVEGGNYYFDPETIEVTAGEEVTITLDNVGGFHDFRVPELEEGTEQFQGPETRSFTLEIEEPGTYEFICSIGNHAAQGMKGTIEVTEG